MDIQRPPINSIDTFQIEYAIIIFDLFIFIPLNFIINNDDKTWKISALQRALL